MFKNDFRKFTKLMQTFILFVLITGTISAQSGKITGIVTDAASGDPLFGANVLIVGTSIGAATDFYGEFVIPNVPYGTHIVAIRYIGYKEQTVVVDLNDANQEHDIKMTLEAEMIEGETVTVTAQAQGQMGAINQQLTSNTIKNVVSAEKIQQLPDADAATALSRLPGISLMNGGQVVIRGIQASQNLILVNGVQLPSTDNNTRATSLSFVSSNMLAGIEVVKVVTPDMDANVVGGTVNLKLREAASGLHADAMIEGSLNEQDNQWGNYKGWASISNRFFDDKLGVFIQGNVTRFNGGNDQANAGFVQHQSAPYGEASYRMDNFNLNDDENVYSNYGGSIILDYKLPKGGLVFQNTYSSAVYDNATHVTTQNFNSNQIQFRLSRDENFKTLYVNALQFDYDLDKFNVEASISHSYSDKETGIRFTDGTTSFSNAVDAPWGLDANGNMITYSGKRNELTMEEAYDIKINPDYYINSKLQDNAIIRDETYEQHIYNAKLDFTIPVTFSSDVTSEFKVGGKFTRTTRENDMDRWYKRVAGDDFYPGVSDFLPYKTLSKNSPLLFSDVINNNYTRGKYFLDGEYNYIYAFDIDKLSDFMDKAKEGWGPSGVHKEGSTVDDFNGTELFSAGYVMGNFKVGSKFNLIAGARYEHYNMKFKATNFFTTHPVDGNGKDLDTLNTNNSSNTYLLPNIQARYKFTDWLDVRAAYTQTLSRPNYQALMPKIQYSEGVYNFAGNLNLKPSLSHNVDLYLSFYNNEIGLFTVGGFYKKIDNVVLAARIFNGSLSEFDISFPDSSFWEGQGIKPPAVSEQINTYLNNPNPAYVQGLEFDWQTNFWYLPAPFNSVVFNINYTKVFSEMDYRQVRMKIDSETIIVNGRPREVQTYSMTDTIRTARLERQANDILNIALGVDYKGFSGRISFNMQGNVLTSVGSRPEEDNYSGNIYKWDFTLKQELPIEGLSLSLNGVNIFHNASNTYRKFRRTPGGEIGEYLSSTTYSPRIFQLALRYTL